MPQIFIHPKSLNDGHFTLDLKESHHVLNVLRKKAGDKIHLFDGAGRRYLGEISGVSAESGLKGRVLKELSETEKTATVTLFQGLPKGSKFDYVIEKATELGVDRIIPFISQKNVIKISEDSTKLARWNRLAEAASKQCGRSTLPAIEPVQPLKLLSAQLKTGVSLLFMPDGKAVLPGLDFNSTSQINLIIGPESGFSKEEAAWMHSLRCVSVSLGSLVLRTETAGLVALSLVNYELGLL